jgi:putative DNA primase/helicase
VSDDDSNNVHTLAPVIKPERPSYACHAERVRCNGRVLAPGLYFHTLRDNKPADVRICSPLEVLAVTSDNHGDNYGLLVRFLPSRAKVWRQWSVPMELLAGEGTELRAALLRMGVTISPRHRGALVEYLIESSPEREALAATRVGWHGRGLFVLPRQVIGEGDVVFQSLELGGHEFAAHGSMDAWQAEVAGRCIGNPVLLLAVTAALAGPLLTLLDVDGGGFHLFGDSSSGKTIAMAVAASVWGLPRDFLRTWNATSTGLEGVATMRNDTLLAMDEIGEARAQDVGNIIYALANGTGRQRGQVTGLPRAVHRWRLMVLSTGEMTIGKHMASGGVHSKAGQELRMLDVPVYRRFGAFDDLHDLAADHDAADVDARRGAGRAFADALKHASGKHHGHAGPAFVAQLVAFSAADPDAAAADLDARFADMRQAFPVSTGQEARAVASFAVAALAGELAIEFGILPWPSSTASAGLVEMYGAWIGHRGKGQSEELKILRLVLAFIDRHAWRFSDISDTDATQAPDRAGWWRQVGDGRQYLFTPGALAEAAPSYDLRRISACLSAAGVIAVDGGGRNLATKVSVPGGDRPRLYPVSYAALQRVTDD